MKTLKIIEYRRIPVKKPFGELIEPRDLFFLDAHGRLCKKVSNKMAKTIVQGAYFLVPAWVPVRLVDFISNSPCLYEERLDRVEEIKNWETKTRRYITIERYR